MAKIIVDSPDQEAHVIQNLVQWELRGIKAYAERIVWRKFKRWGLIPRENEGGRSKTNCSREDKKIQRRGDGLSATKILLTPKLPFENLQMIVREANLLLLIKEDS
jgi:hypothetical protein